MRRRRRLAAGLLLAAMLGLLSVASRPTPAEATAWNCQTYVWGPTAGGVCYRGSGTYRVELRCNMARWPYSTVVRGSTASVHGPDGISYAGCPWGTHLVDAWVHVF